MLKAGERRFQFVARVLSESQVVPCLSISGVERNRVVEGLFRLVQFLQRHQRYAFVDGSLGQLWISLERLGKRLGSALGKLLPHQRHAPIVELDRFLVTALLRSARQSCYHKNPRHHRRAYSHSPHSRVRRSAIGAEPYSVYASARACNEL